MWTEYSGAIRSHMIALVHAITTQPVTITPHQVIKVIATPIGAEPGPPLEQYREAHPDNRGEDNSIDHDPGEASEQVVFPTSPTVSHEQHWGERPEDPHWDERQCQKRCTDSGFVLAAEPDALMGGHDSQVQEEPGGSATQLLGHTELLAAPCPSEYCGDLDRHRDSPNQKWNETEEGPDVPYARGCSERLAHAVVERMMKAEIANEQVTYAGIACESREVSEADNDQGNNCRE